MVRRWRGGKRSRGAEERTSAEKMKATVNEANWCQLGKHSVSETKVRPLKRVDKVGTSSITENV